jgi:hypothetical protein
VNRGIGSMWAVNKGPVLQGSALVNTLQARALGTSVCRAQDWGMPSAWGVMQGGGRSAAFSFAARAQVLAAAETASGLARFPECSPAPYGSSMGRLRLGMPMCSAVSPLSTLPRRFSPRLTPMRAAVGGCHRLPPSLGTCTYSVSLSTQAWGMTGDRVRVMTSRGAGERESWV